ncbi:hypothetical protein [Polyangium mundeleinium]|uniref:Uncharacterized protein n=1 Tax=Polyangium mundeleinium TaxID=2995306 RepID=A0ABT5EHW7_9BACT|nr:hypothetical protein [Polyangium mundeleinium]MDC0740517.1 hypothetical protein [Polyangium mundeleinium]
MFLALISLPLADARANGEPRIVLVAPAKDEGIAVRIRAELEALHFEVLDVEMEAGPPAREPLEEAARKSDAVAAVRIVPSSAGVEVWIVDRMTGKTVLRELVAEHEPPHGGSATIALRVMELLRASLMELDAPRPPPGEVAPPAVIREILAPRPAEAPPAAARPNKRPLLTLELGPSMLMSPGGIGPSGLLHTSMHILRPSERIGMSAFVSIPVVPANLLGPEGVATSRIGLLGVGFRGSFAPRGAAWNVNVGAGLSAVLLHFEGRPARSYAGTSETLFTFAPYLRAGLGYAVTPHLRIRADVLTGVTAQRPVVQFVGRVAATWGLPFVSPSLGAELSWN